MKAVQKVSLSLLLAVVAFSLFAIVAFSGLFQVIQTNFYDARVRGLVTANLAAVARAVDRFNADNYRRFRAVLTDGAVRRIYSPNQSSEDIFARNNLFQKLIADYPGLLFVRFIDAAGNIHFSTLPADILQQGKYEITYKPLAEAERGLPPKQLELAGPTDGRVLESEGRFVYRLPAVDLQGEQKGTALFYVASGALTRYLVRQSLLSVGQAITLLPERGILSNVDGATEPALVAAVEKAWRDGARPADGEPIAADASGQQLLLFGAASQSVGMVGTVVPRSDFVLSPSLRILLAGSIFIATFLIAFFVLNLRQDKMLILSDRIKRFQIAFLKGYLEERQELDWARWHQELEQRSVEVKREIKRGIGRLTKERDRAVEELIDKSWSDILSVVGKRVERERLEQVEVKGLEETIRRVLASVELALPARTALPAAPATPTRGSVDAALSAAGGAEAPARSAVSGAEADEASEPEELEEVEEAEAVEEAEPLEEVEPLEEAEAVEEGVSGPAADWLSGWVPTAEAVATSGRPLSASVPEAELVELEVVSDHESVEPEEQIAEAGDEEIFYLLPVEDEKPATERPPKGRASGSRATESPAPDRTDDGLSPPRILSGAASGGEMGGSAEAMLEEEPTGLAAEEAVHEAPSDGGAAGPSLRDEAARPQIDDFADLGLTESDILPVGGEGWDEEPAELEPVEAGGEGSGGLSGASEDRHYTWDAFEEVEALDLEAIFHGEELLADIDIFDEPVGEPLPEEGAHRERADQGPLRGARERTEEEVELLPIGEATPGEASLETVEPAFALLRGFDRFVTPPAARRLPEEMVASLIEEGAPTESLEEQRADEAAELVEELPEPAEEGASQPPLSKEPSVEEAAELLEEEAEAGEELGASRAAEARGAVTAAASGGSESVEGLADGAFNERLRLLASRGLVEVYSLSRGLQPGESARSETEAVGVQNGLFQVREEVIRGTTVASDREFSTLVESVVSAPGPRLAWGEGSAEGRLEPLSIDGLLTRTRAVRGPDDGRSRGNGGEPRMLLSEAGLSYDAIRSQFRSSNLGVTKSLMRASQNADAIYAAILLPTGNGLSTRFSLGLDERNASALSFAFEDPVYRNLLARRAVIYLRVPVVGIPSFDEKLSPKDARFVKGCLYLPVIYDGTPGYLFFGLKDTAISVEDYIARVLSLVR